MRSSMDTSDTGTVRETVDHSLYISADDGGPPSEVG